MATHSTHVGVSPSTPPEGTLLGVEGLFVATPSPALVEMVGAAGYDVAILDAEHALVSPDTLQEMIRAAEVSGVEPWVRVSEHDPGFVLRVLDAGATGIVIPH